MQRNGRQFVYAVDDGRKAEKLGTASFRALPKTPVSHTWEVGQTVVYVQPTAAGWMPTSLLGTIAAIVKDGRQSKARIIWHAETKVAPIIGFQRLRPFLLIHDFISNTRRLAQGGQQSHR
jgi:hypothetical protein